VARKLRIGLDAVLFVDDNPGELSAVASELPSVATLHAAPDADLTRRALEYYPGLWAWERSAADAVRAADLEADMARDELAVKTVDVKKYLASGDPHRNGSPPASFAPV
jgi:predicted enzyme involved in methoxymalonyl-ACP biosynthesis